MQEGKSIEEKNCEVFDSGMFNHIAIGYAVIDMKEANLPAQKIKEVEAIMHSNYDFISARDALKHYKCC